MNELDIYIKSLVGKFYKIIPMKEENNKNLNVYLDSLSIELSGGLYTFGILKESSQYTTLRNIINYFINNEYTFSQCKREVFKAIEIIHNMHIKYENWR